MQNDTDGTIVPYGQTDSIPAVVQPIGPGDLYAALLADAGKPTTARARESDLRDVARFLGLPDGRAACAALVSSGSAGANAIATAYKREMLDNRRAASTVNRRLSHLRRVIDLARRFGVVNWTLEADNLPGESYRDTKGPGAQGWKRIREAALARSHTPAGSRDLAIIYLLYYSLLRRGEVVELDLSHWEPEHGRLSIIGKGRYEREYRDVNEYTAKSLNDWLKHRGTNPGPMFIRLDHASFQGEPARLTGKSVWDVIRMISKKGGLKKPARPHGLRHQAATRLAEATGGNLLEVQQALRHKDPNATQRYIDNLHNTGGKAARILGELD